MNNLESTEREREREREREKKRREARSPPPSPIHRDTGEGKSIARRARRRTKLFRTYHGFLRDRVDFDLLL